MNRFGFLKVAAAVPHVRIADCDYNAQHITELIRKGADRGASIILFPELCITSYTCGDLIQQPALLHAAEQALGLLFLKCLMKLLLAISVVVLKVFVNVFKTNHLQLVHNKL